MHPHAQVPLAITARVHAGIAVQIVVAPSHDQAWHKEIVSYMATMAAL